MGVIYFFHSDFHFLITPTAAILSSHVSHCQCCSRLSPGVQTRPAGHPAQCRPVAALPVLHQGKRRPHRPRNRGPHPSVSWDSSTTLTISFSVLISVENRGLFVCFHFLFFCRPVTSGSGNETQRVALWRPLRNDVSIGNQTEIGPLNSLVTHW